MSTNQDDQKDKTKSLLLTSAKILVATAVAVIIILLARSCSENHSRLEATQNSRIRERDSLMNEIRKVQDRFVSLQTEKDNVSQALEKENAANKQLLSEKAGNIRQIRTSGAKISEQKERLNVISGKNDSLLAKITDLQGKMDELNRKIAETEKESEILNNNIAGLNNNIKEKDSVITKVNEALITEHITDSIKLLPVFVTAGELTSGLGMAQTQVPYSHYFIGGSVLFGMEFNKRFLAGIGTGAHAFNGGVLVPLFLEFRYGFPIRNYTPYIFSQAGALMNFSSYDRSNIYANGGIGLRHAINDNLAFNIATGIYTHSSGVSGRDSFLNFKVGLIYSKSKVTLK